MTAREDLHRLVDELDEERVDDARELLHQLRQRQSPLRTAAPAADGRSRLPVRCPRNMTSPNVARRLCGRSWATSDRP